MTFLNDDIRGQLHVAQRFRETGARAVDGKAQHFLERDLPAFVKRGMFAAGGGGAGAGLGVFHASFPDEGEVAEKAHAQIVAHVIAGVEEAVPELEKRRDTPAQHQAENDRKRHGHGLFRTGRRCRQARFGDDACLGDRQ
ncbi:hypothetical protein D3C78_1071910 [compost metagenome]